MGRPPTLYERLERIEGRLGHLEIRVNYLFGALAIIVVLANVGLAVAIALAIVGAQGGVP